MASRRALYWVRIQSSMKRLATRTLTTVWPSCRLISAGGRGRIQVLNCCSGSSVARRSQLRCHRLDRSAEGWLAALDSNALMGVDKS